MRNLRSILAAAFAFGVLVAPVSAAPTSTGDFVSGGGYRLTLDGERRVQFRVTGHVTPDEGASGSYSYRNLAVDVTFSGPITCLDVDGSQAAVGGVITRVVDEFGTIQVGDSFLVFLIDNGDPFRGQSGPDVVSQTYILPYDAGNVAVPGDFPSTCPDAATTDHDAFTVEGNIQVKDNLDS